MASAARPAPMWLPGQPMLAGNQVIAMWLPVPGAVKYILYLNGEKITESVANQFIGPGPDGAGKFEYQVTSVDGTGTESPKSSSGIINIVKIDPPSNIFARLDKVKQSALIRWDRVKGAAIYNIYKADKKEGPYILASSQINDTFKDTGLEFGKEYYYTVSAKDTSGKESERSVPFLILMKKEEMIEKAMAPPLRIVPSKSVERRSKWTGTELPATSGALVIKDFGIYTTALNHILVLDEELNLLERYKIVFPEAIKGYKAGNLRAIKMDMFDDETGVITDLNNSAVIFFELTREQALVTSYYILKQPTKEQEPEIYDKIPASRRGDAPELSGVGITADGLVWAFGVKDQVLYEIDPEDGLIGWKIEYNTPDGKATAMFQNVNDVITLPDGDVILVSPLGRKVVRIDSASVADATLTAKYEIGTGVYPGYIAKFLGINGATVSSDGELVVSDPGMSTIQVFDLETGTYLYAIGGPTGKPDAKNHEMAAVDYTYPAYAYIFPDGARVAIYSSFEKIWDVREFGGEGVALVKKYVEEAMAPPAE